jgi:hypothetical protein
LKGKFFENYKYNAMQTFIEFIESQEDSFLWEMTGFEAEVKKPPASEWYKDFFFYFDVEGDNCTPKYCYHVYFEPIAKNSYEIEFRRLMNNSKDERRGVGIKVLGAVKYALMEFVKNKNPDLLQWSPAKTKIPNPVTGNVTNPDGRRDAYENFAINNLFPRYVSVKTNQWIRSDIYERDYASKGYPQIPENLNNIAQKKQFIQQIRMGLQNS